MKKKVINYLWLIPFLLGIVIGIIGISKVIKANDIYVPEMGDPGWFEASSKQTEAQSSGIMMMAGGFGFLGVFGSILTIGIVKTINSKQFQSARQIEKTLEELDNAEFGSDNQTTDLFEKLSNITKQKEEPLFCEYCGSILKKDSNTCDACGARYKKQK